MVLLRSMILRERWLLDLLILVELLIITVYEKFEDTQGVIRSQKSRKDRQYNDQKKRVKRKEWSAQYYKEN
jgi:hypothetical protein